MPKPDLAKHPGRWSLALGALHAILFWLSFPPVFAWPLAFVSLWPLLYIAWKTPKPARSALMVGLAVIPMWLALHWWLRAALLLGFALWGWALAAMDYRSGEIGASFLHGPLLLFHEAGHLIFRPFGEWAGVFGGTLAQLLMPALIVVRERPVAAATAVMPPWPSARASVAAHSRKRRSSRRGLRISTFLAMTSTCGIRPRNHEARKRPSYLHTSP